MNTKVEICSPEEAERYIRLLTRRESMLHGYVDIVCREADGTPAWEIHQPNLITDQGRRRWARGVFYTQYIFSSPSLDVADASRATLTDTGIVAAQQSIGLTPTYDAPSLTKTWTLTPAFSAPASNRRIGVVGLCGDVKPDGMVSGILAYTRITPTKTQTTTQTLEVVYKITLTPVY